MKKSTSTLLTATIALSTLASCAKKNVSMSEITQTPPAKVSTYVLVHGAWQAPYVWDNVKTNLEQKGNKVVTVELPGHGSDSTATYLLSIDAYRDKVVDAILKTDGKVILVGHSMGGMVITSVAEKIPERIGKLVYIGAFLPAQGQAIVDLAMMDPGSLLSRSLIESPDRLTLDVKQEDLTKLFIADGSDNAKQKVIANYRPEPAIPFTNKANITVERFGAVEKVYIKTLKDIVISPALQDRMIDSAGIKTVYSVNTSHSPFLAQPKEVSDLLLKIGE